MLSHIRSRMREKFKPMSALLFVGGVLQVNGILKNTSILGVQ